MTLPRMLSRLVACAALALTPTLALAAPPGIPGAGIAANPAITRPPSALPGAATRTSPPTIRPAQAPRVALPVTTPKITTAALPKAPTTFAVLAKSQAFSNGPALRAPDGHFTPAGGRLAAISNPRDAHGRFVAAPRETDLHGGFGPVGGHVTATKDWGGQLRSSSSRSPYDTVQHVTPMFDARSGKPLQNEALSVGGHVGSYVSRTKLEQYQYSGR